MAYRIGPPATYRILQTPIPRAHVNAPHFNSDRCVSPFALEISIRTSGFPLPAALHIIETFFLTTHFSGSTPVVSAPSPSNYYRFLALSLPHRKIIVEQFLTTDRLPSIPESLFMSNGLIALLFILGLRRQRFLHFKAESLIYMWFGPFGVTNKYADIYVNEFISIIYYCL